MVPTESLFPRELLEATMQLDLHPISRSKTATAGQLLRKYLRSMPGIPLYRVTGDPALVGYSSLMPAQQLQATDANGAVTKEAVIVNISVAALGNAQNIQLYFYNETTHAWNWQL